MRITVDTKTRLSAVGWIGAIMFVGAPVVAGFRYIAYVDIIQRGLRYGTDTSLSSDFRGLMMLSIGSAAVAAAGLVMVLAGREHKHQVEIYKEEEPER